MRAGKRGSEKAGRVARTATCIFVVVGIYPGTATAQNTLPRWSVAAGSGFVFRSINNGSFGINLRAARVVPVLSGLYLEPAVVWHGYLSSDAWFDRPDFMFCPEPGESCETPPRRDGVGFAGIELGLAYLKSGAANMLHPIAGLGVYRSTSHSNAMTRVGANLGVAWPFGGSLRGPVLGARYFRMFNDPRFTSLLALSLGWYF